MNIFGFNFGGLADAKSTELPAIFPFSVNSNNFVYADVINIYTRILTDVLERTQGIPEKWQHILWDNCLGSESQEGLVTLLAKAMTDKSDLYLVFRADLDVLRKATMQEQTVIKQDYEANGSSSTGVYISFKKNTRTDMVKIYSSLEYCTVAALNKSMNLSKSVQIKISDLRASVALVDASKAQDQGVAIAQALAKGQDVMLDAKDVIDTLKPDLTATKASMEFIDNKRSLYLGMPASYIDGSGQGGLSDTGKADSKAVERGLKQYFFSIIKPVSKALFNKVVTFKSDDFDQLDSALETLKTFDLTSNDHLSFDNKTLIINKVFGLPENESGDEPEKDVTPPVTVPPPNAAPVKTNGSVA